MPIYAVKKNNESVDRLINRFKRQVQQSRLLLKIKNKKFHQSKKKKRQVKAAAVMREYYRSEKRKMAYY